MRVGNSSRGHRLSDLTGDLGDAQRQQLLAVAEKCPLHKVMTQARTEVRTELVQAPG